ncbi:MAG: ZPR1 zinc finger domain-containing protein [Pyrodictiaceae archaeon]
MEKLKGNEPSRVVEYVTKCPACGKATFKVNEYLYDVPLLGKIILTVGRCDACGYKFNDVKLAEPRGPRRLIYKVESPRDVNTIILKSASARVVIPELGLEMSPGPASEGFISTIEGVLRRFMDILDFLCSQENIKRDTCWNAKRALEEAIEGRRKFTLVIEDPEGASKILSDSVVEEPLKPSTLS